MKKYTDYRLDLFTGLLILNALPACMHTRQKLGMDEGQPTAQKSPRSLVTDSASGRGVPSITDPMFLDEEIMRYLRANSFSIESIKTVIDRKLDPNAQDEWGRGLLIHTILQGSFVKDAMLGEIDDLAGSHISQNKPEEAKQVVQFLIGKGAHLNHQDECGFTALMVAAYKRYEAVVNLLLECVVN